RPQIPAGACVLAALFAVSCIPRVKSGAVAGAATGQSSGASQGPAVRVNQVGYFTRLPKHATLRSDSDAPVPWELRGAGGAVLAKGTTKPFGDDKAAGEHLHIIDFSSFATPGSGFVLAVGADKSSPFDVGDSLYKDLRIDALRFFYYS